MSDRHAATRPLRTASLLPFGLLAAGLLMHAPQPCFAERSDIPAPPLRVMTFNVLHSSVRSPAGPWSMRRPLVARTIRAARPDVACLQEVSEIQLADLTRDLPEYEVVPGARSGPASFYALALVLAASFGTVWLTLMLRGRRSHERRSARRMPGLVAGAGALFALVSALTARYVLGGFLDSGERCPILLLRGRVTAVQLGSFWFSPHPDRPGSTLPGSPTPHVVHWTRVADSRTGSTWTIYNTHLGLLPWTARATARALFDRLDRDWNGGPQVLAGDLNCAPNGSLMRALLADRGDRPPGFHDTWSDAARREGTAGTFHLGIVADGPRFDYILVRPSLKVASARTAFSPRVRPFPSDHDPLLVELVRGSGAAD